MFNKIVLLVLTMSICLYCITESSNLPSYIQICKRNNSNLPVCIIEAINHLRPKLKEGIPEINLPPLDPLALSEIKLKSGSEQTQINANITNLLVDGATTFKILSLTPDLVKDRYLVQFTIPVLDFKGNYDIDMNILVLKYKGKGPIKGKFNDYVFDILLKGDKVKKNNQIYLHFRNLHIKLHPGTSEIHLLNLFGGAENGAVLGKATNEVINENTDLLIDEIKPALEQSLSKKFTAIANSITSSFTYDELFPDS